jgi:hypothetical protein
MSETTNTPYSSQCDILSEIWMNYRDDKEFIDFMEYNDIGLPLAHFIHEGIVSTSPLAQQYIEETFNVLLAGLEIEDTGFETLEEVFFAANKDK